MQLPLCTVKEIAGTYYATNAEMQNQMNTTTNPCILFDTNCLSSDWIVADNIHRTQYFMEKIKQDIEFKNVDKFICATLQRSATRKRFCCTDLYNKLKGALQAKPPAKRGNARNGVSTKYCYYGYRADYLGKPVVDQYVFQSNVDEATQQLHHSNMASVVEALENSAMWFFETVLLHDFADFKDLQKCTDLPTALDTENGIGTQVAIGLNYISPTHVDNDFFYCMLSVVVPPSCSHKMRKAIAGYFIFGQHKVAIPL